jgi:maltose alpha-D-glucosyltransferase/alpha-amylase
MADRLDIARLDLLVEQSPHAVLAAQRWFRSKSRPISDLTLEDAAPLSADEDSQTDAALLIVRVSFADDGADELYLMPMTLVADDDALQQRGIVAVRDASGGVLREPRPGDGVWRRLVAGIADEIVLPALHGSFVFHVLPALHELIPSAQQAIATLDERQLAGEQSNTSIVLGERLLLKLYRSLQHGENPDLELPRFLSQTGFAQVPAVAGYVRYLPALGEPSVALMLQTFVAGAVDAWRWLLDELAGAASPEAALEAVRRIGEITARMHDALAARPSDHAFPVRDATGEELRDWRAAAEHQLELAIRAVPSVADVAGRIRDGFAAIERAQATRVTRIHGDYHLGQLLRDRADFWVIDFEGEPARPLAERRAPGSPLKDVAGMLRSLDYAARTVERSGTHAGFDAEAWLGRARDSFLGSYRSGVGSLNEGLLRAFELEKACYEVRYEANFRPDWIWLPLQALGRLAADAR